MFSLELIHESQITPKLDAAFIELLCLANPHEREIFSTQGRGWHGVKPVYCTYIERNGRPVAYVGVADRTIRVGPHSGIGVPPMSPVQLRIAGVQNVSVDPNHRGEGLSLQALNLAMSQALKQNFDAGLLFCTPNLQRLYSKAGFQTLLNASITRADNNTDVPLPKDNIAMFLPLGVKEFPPGPIHLQGNDW